MGNNSAKGPTPYFSAGTSLAGTTSYGILYAVSVDKESWNVNLWSYNDLQRSWKRLVTSNGATEPTTNYSYYAISAIYKEELGHVYAIIIESPVGSACLFRFTTGPPMLDAVLLPAKDEYTKFDSNKPLLTYFGGDLFVIGPELDDPSTLRIYRVVINDDENTFTLSQVWRSNGYDSLRLYTALEVGNQLIVATSDHVLNFTPETMVSSQQWSEPIKAMYPSGRIGKIATDYGFIACSSVRTRHGIWMFPPNQCKVIEAVVQPDGALLHRREIEYGACFLCTYDVPISAVSSASQLFWASDCCDKTRSKLIDVPTLQYICMSKLFTTAKEFKECKNEEDALKLGIPPIAWRRFCH